MGEVNENILLTVLQSAPHGGSPKGISYYSKAATCGRKANLDAAAGPRVEQPEDADADPDALRVGTYYHLLQEFHMKGDLNDVVWDCTDTAYTPSFLEAVRLFRAYIAHWGSVGKRYGGVVVGAEVAIPSTPAGQTRIRAMFGDDVTGRVDSIVRIDDPGVAYANTGLVLEKGLYLVDFKSLKAHSDQHQWSYAFSLQAATYLEIYNLEHPEAPALGMIFDCIFKHKTIKKEPDPKTGRSSYQAYLQLPQQNDSQVIEALVKIGKRNVDEDLSNPAACLSGFSPCWWFKSGKCGRF